MRVILGLLAAIIVFTWLGFELRASQRGLAQVLFALAGVLAALLVGAWFGLYGA